MNKEEAKESFRRLELLVKEFIRKAPEFENDEEISVSIGREMGNVKWWVLNEST
jgi:hypothetical protein